MYKVNDTVYIDIPDDESVENPWLRGPWRPQGKEYAVTSDELQVIGQIPDDLDGIYVRNTHNQALMPIGIYHPFDGDGMLHAIRFRDGAAEYRNAFVRTTGFLAEQGAKQSLWPGIMQPEMYSRRGWGSMGAMKDNAGTDVLAHAGKLYATMSQGSEPWCLSPTTLETLGPNTNWARLVPEGMASHYKVDNETGDMIFFNFAEKPPYLNYGVVSKEDNLVHYVPIDLPGARWPHDIGMTKNYSILHDLPFFFDPELLAKGVRKGTFHHDVPARFGIIPRFGRSEDVKWFEAKPAWVMHLANCYEDGDWVIQDGCLWPDLVKPPIGEEAHDVYAKIRRNVDATATGSHMYRWMFNMATGQVREFPIDDEVTEFPVISNDFVGRPYRYSYNATFLPGEWLLTGVKRYDSVTGNTTRTQFGPGRFGSEPAIARRLGASEREDDGYGITFVTDMNEDRSEAVVFRLDDMEGDPVCRIILPERISVGTHACWVEGDRIEGEGRVLA
jgi:carotenoid cleavage dioxygenase